MELEHRDKTTGEGDSVSTRWQGLDKGDTGRQDLGTKIYCFRGRQGRE